jgi:hypothetical protein
MLVWALVASSRSLSSQVSSYVKKINARKSLSQFEFWKVLETSKYTKQVFQ